MNIKRRIAVLEQQRNPGGNTFVCSAYPGETEDDAIARARRAQGIANDQEFGSIVVLRRFADDRGPE